jgi:condensin complex subunit 1
MRNAILEVLGLLIRELSLTEPGALDMDDTKHVRLLESFFQLVLERLLDLNSYVRAKAASVLLKTCDLPPKLPKLRLELTTLAVRSLHDKAATVRKNCLALLTRLVLTHPYGRLHGGELALEEWQDRLNKLDEELKVLDLPDEAEIEARRLMEDVAEEEEEEEEDAAAAGEEKEEEEADPDHSMDSTAAPPKNEAPPRKKKRAPRRSMLDLAATDQSTALAQVDSDTLQRLRLTKAYYTDAITFIEALELAMDTVTELLASSVKSEVLEAIEFCKVAKEYKLEASEQGIRRMLHLIWTKDETPNTATAAASAEGAGGGAGGDDDAKEAKGVRSRLIECYSQLYFEPPEALPEKDQIAFVARNVIECGSAFYFPPSVRGCDLTDPFVLVCRLTRDATLAELTSLEQLLAVMMAKGVVSDEVINKLWQVYSASSSVRGEPIGEIAYQTLSSWAGTSKEIPRFQRRGAIIVLGMFAQTKPEVVADHVETLLRIGLGHFGRADLVLAKYTCIALGRVGGSVKKVKGKSSANLREDPRERRLTLPRENCQQARSVTSRSACRWTVRSLLDSPKRSRPRRRAKSGSAWPSRPSTRSTRSAISRTRSARMSSAR